MTSIKKIIWFFLSTILFYGCLSEREKNNEIGVIDISKAMDAPQSISASDFCKSISYVCLETTAESTIGMNPNIALLDSFIVISVRNEPVKVFSRKSGSFLYSIGRIGEGLGEYSKPVVYWMNESAQTLTFLGYNNRLVIYGIDGTFIEESSLPDSWKGISRSYLSGLVDHDTIHIATCSGLGLEKMGLISFLNSGKTILDTLTMENGSPPVEWQPTNMEIVTGQYAKFGGDVMILSFEKNKFFANIGNKKMIWKSGEDLMYRKEFSDTLYAVKSRAMEARYIFNLGKWRIPYEDRFSRDIINHY